MSAVTRSLAKRFSSASSSERKKRDEPGIALASGAAAQLVVDAAGVVALGADDVQAAGRDDLLMVVVAVGLGLGEDLVVDLAARPRRD